MDTNTSDKWEVAVQECGKHCGEVTALSIIYEIACFYLSSCRVTAVYIYFAMCCRLKLVLRGNCLATGQLCGFKRSVM